MKVHVLYIDGKLVDARTEEDIATKPYSLWEVKHCRIEEEDWSEERLREYKEKR